MVIVLEKRVGSYHSILLTEKKLNFVKNWLKMFCLKMFRSGHT